MLILFTTSSSGVVLFAFECSEFGHYHFSILNKITCADFENEIDTHKHLDDNDICCHNKHTCNKTPNNEIETIHTNENCGTSYIKTLSLGIDLDIVKKIIEKISVIKHFTQNNFLTNDKNNYQFLFDNSYIQKTNQFVDYSLQIVEYIRTITSKTSDDPLI